MRILSVLLVACCAWGVERTAVAAPSKPVHTNKSRFRIPYNFDPAEMRRLAAKEIRLYMSTDRGGRWELIQSVPPETGRFNFQAVRDGEYWFSVRTLDGQGRLHPSDEAVEPGLQVIVDTAKPRLSLILRETTPGRVQLAWSAVDEALDVAKLRLEFIQPGSTNWQTMGVVPKAADQTEWSVPQGGVVAVRGSVADLAGNLGESQTQVSVTAGAGPPGTPDFKQPIAGREDPPLAMTDRFPSAAQYPRGTVEQTRVLGDIDAALADGTMSRNSLVSLRQGSFPENAPAEPPKAVDPRVRFVNSRNFQIAYKVQYVGPSGISGVELFITTDHGAKWYRYGEDEDRQSPFQVQVPRD